MPTTDLQHGHKKALWIRLRDYHFNDLVPPHLSDKVFAAFGGADASTQAFASKVARKLGWSRGFALRAIAEYRKFVFLGITSEFSVTPPKVIDQVWHEHLLFSRGYREFCRVVLQRDFDHHPELLPSDTQTAQFQAQYEATLAAYRTEFNRTPPADIWGKPKFTAVRDQELPEPRRLVDDGGASMTWDSTPLHASFSAADGDAGFGDGGGFSGGGSSGDFGSDSSGDSGGDSGSSSDGGGSSCSSSCGGGGGD